MVRSSNESPNSLQLEQTYVYRRRRRLHPKIDPASRENQIARVRGRTERGADKRYPWLRGPKYPSYGHTAAACRIVGYARGWVSEPELVDL